MPDYIEDSLRNYCTACYQRNADCDCDLIDQLQDMEPEDAIREMASHECSEDYIAKVLRMHVGDVHRVLMGES